MDSLRSNFSSPSFISTLKKPPLLQRTASFSGTSTFAAGNCTGAYNMVRPLMTGESASVFSYKKFIHFALEETKKYTDLAPSTLQENFSCLAATDGKAQLEMLAFESPKIRLLRSLTIEGSDGMQVLDFAVFPRPEFDLPIFCANFFTTASMNIVVLDLNPLRDVISQKDYKEKYYKHLIPLGLEYAEISCSFCPGEDYLKSWLELMEQASREADIPQIMLNLEMQHRYLTWRAEKDPGHQVLRRLTGKTLAKEIIGSFLFNGVDGLGNKTFLDYFPEYKCDDGTINQKRSMIGKSFKSRPWDARGEFVGDTLR